MSREARSSRVDRLQQILAVLTQTYPNAHCELNYRNPLELLIATILSAQCTDKKVNRVTERLFERFPEASDYAAAPAEELQNAIRSLGMFRVKARNIKSCCGVLVQKHQGRVPSTLKELIALDGVGRKTANVVLGNAFGINEGVVVDTHVSRLAQRLRLTRQRTPEKIELDLMRVLPRKLWTQFSHWLIWHGRHRCRARNPMCDTCELQRLCPSAGPRA